MRRLTLIFIAFTAILPGLFANPGDTTIVQTFTFNLAKSNNKVDTFQFPDGSKQYSKVLMYYTIKCDPKGNYNTPDGGQSYPNLPCGQWDYDVYTDILRPTGQVNASNKPIYDIWRLFAYITPYGINLDKGIAVLTTDGWTYTADVTDFLPILKNKVILKDNNAQELVDIKFIFIEGSPAREVIDIKKVWNSAGITYPGYWSGFPLSKFDSIVHDTTFVLNSNEKMAKLRTIVTGHDAGGNSQCAEFCGNIHKVTAGGQVVRSWNIKQDCGDNAMYPQGGTWIYNRGGWCPGLEGKLNEFELTPYIKNNSITFDYSIQSYPYGVYRMTSYLVTYSDILHENDAQADMIISPTDDPNQRRYNPSGFKPVVVFENIGKNKMTSATINYGFEGGEIFTQTWNGSLSFLQKDTIQLEKVPDWNKIDGKSAVFYFEIASVNGHPDATPYNNRISSKCTKPLLITQNNLRFAFTTNKRPKETSWQLTDINGKVLYEAKTDTLVASKTYNTDISLKDGTYCISLYDTGGDGLGFWNNTAAGNGSAKLQYFNDAGKPTTLYAFNIDFGLFSKFWFAVNKFSENFNTSIVGKGQVGTFPNPADNFVYIDCTNIDGENLTAVFYDFLGKKVLEAPIQPLNFNKIDIQSLNSGVNIILIKDGKKQIARSKVIVDKTVSN